MGLAMPLLSRLVLALRAPAVRVPAALALAPLALASPIVTPAAARPGSSELRCNVAGGFGYFVVGQRGLTCVYYRLDGAAEFYVGSSDTYGIDLGTLNARALIFRVSGVDPDQPGQLAGTFVGAAAGVTVGYGVSTKALVGGASGKTLLLPLDNFNNNGANFTTAVGVFKLTYAGSEPRSLRERY